MLNNVTAGTSSPVPVPVEPHPFTPAPADWGERPRCAVPGCGRARADHPTIPPPRKARP